MIIVAVKHVNNTVFVATGYPLAALRDSKRGQRRLYSEKSLEKMVFTNLLFHQHLRFRRLINQ